MDAPDAPHLLLNARTEEWQVGRGYEACACVLTPRHIHPLCLLRKRYLSFRQAYIIMQLVPDDVL